MTLYFAGGEQTSHYDIIIRSPRAAILAAYGDKRKLGHVKADGRKLFLDSGAFSNFTGKSEATLPKYIEYLKRSSGLWTCYAAMDVIGDAEGTWRNVRKMEDAGLKPIPCFHHGSSFKALEKILKNHKHIALGGMVPIARRYDLLKPWLDECFRTIGKDVRVHGFGICSMRLFKRYPFHSADATSWLFYAQKMAEVYVWKGIGWEKAAGMGKSGFYRKQAERHPRLVKRYQHDHVGRSLHNIEELLKAQDFVTELWKRRGIEWND